MYFLKPNFPSKNVNRSCELVFMHYQIRRKQTYFPNSKDEVESGNKKKMLTQQLFILILIHYKLTFFLPKEMQ